MEDGKEFRMVPFPRASPIPNKRQTGLLQGTLNQVVRFGLGARDAPRGGGDVDGDGNGESSESITSHLLLFFHSSLAGVFRTCFCLPTQSICRISGWQMYLRSVHG